MSYTLALTVNVGGCSSRLILLRALYNLFPPVPMQGRGMALSKGLKIIAAEVQNEHMDIDVIGKL